ncbi:MAG: hypothetical protein HRT66_05085 [Flavobacteriaceae bacterium]|nr:hypothetical protein [Flavobacteriaceae bacterium]
MKIVIFKSPKMKMLYVICLLLLFASCKENKTSKLDFLVGTWKMDGKEQYEFWEKSQKDGLVGNSYKLVNNEKYISETLKIKSVGNQLIYGATVLNQNSGETIEFILNPGNKEYLSFENVNHDFPKKIQYKRISADSIKVSVLGENDEGFSYIQIKQRIVN